MKPKNFFVAGAVAIFVATMYLTGCAVALSSPVYGGVYTNVRAPITATDNDQAPTKVGKATATSVLGIVAAGDASIEQATALGGITKIHHVDYETKSFLGLWATYTVIVYGN